jgi:hypothetical protein
MFINKFQGQGAVLYVYIHMYIYNSKEKVLDCMCIELRQFMYGQLPDYIITSSPIDSSPISTASRFLALQLVLRVCPNREASSHTL